MFRSWSPSTILIMMPTRLPGQFPICVICQAKELLQARSYEAAALNALLLSEDYSSPQAELFRTAFQAGNWVVDFGAGKGRLPEELLRAAGEKTIKGIHDFAYDLDGKDAEVCKPVMKQCGVAADNGSFESHPKKPSS